MIIPVYCRSDEHEIYLREALESVANQTFRDFEVVVVDDKSPRDISPILAHIDGLPGLRCIRNESNMGHARSRNTGVEATKAEYVAFLDHDDLWMPDKLALQMEQFEKTPEAGMVFCSVELFGSHVRKLAVYEANIPERPSFLWLIRHGNCIITASAVLIKRSILLDIGLFDHRYTTWDDFDAWLKIVRKHPIVYMREKLALYRLHALNVNYGMDRLNDNKLLTSLALGYWRKAPINEKLSMLPVLARKLIGRVYFHFRQNRNPNI